MSIEKYRRQSAFLVGFLSFILVVFTSLVIRGSYELQTRAIFEEGTGGAGGGSNQSIEEVEEFDRDLDGSQSNRPPTGQSGQPSGGSGPSGGGSSAPVLPPETCTGTCVVYGCSISGRRSTGGTCNYSRFCCTGNQVVKVCAVEGDVCGTSFGTVCCGGLSCSGATSGFCRPGGAAQGAIGAVDTACTNAGGQCVNAGSCGAAGLSTISGGAGCSMGVCCSKASVQTRLECKADGSEVNVAERGSCCSGMYYQPVSGRYVCGNNPAAIAVGGSSSQTCLRDGTTVSSVDLASSCCNGALPAANGLGFTCATGGIKVPKMPVATCANNDTRWSSGVTCCSGTIYRRDGQEYCGVAPAYTVDIAPGQLCQRPTWAPGGVGKCRCNNRIIGMGEVCLVNFGATTNSPGRIRACQNQQQPNCWEVYVCDANNECQWINQNNWVNNPETVSQVYESTLRVGYIVVVENGQERVVKLSDISGDEFARLLREGKIKNANDLYGLSAQNIDNDFVKKVISDPTLSDAEKALILGSVGKDWNPYGLQEQYRKQDIAYQGYRDWQNRTEALIKTCANGQLDAITCAGLLAYQAGDFASLGGVTATQEAAYNWALCNAEANAGLRPGGCFGETVAAGINGVFLADFALSPFGLGITQAATKAGEAIAAIRAGNPKAALVAVFGEGVVNKANLALKYISEGNFLEAAKTMAGNTYVTNSGLRITLEPGTLAPAGGKKYQVTLATPSGSKTFIITGEDYEVLNQILVGGLSRDEANKVVANWVRRKLPYSETITAQMDGGLAVTKTYAEYDNLTDVMGAINSGLCDGVACDLQAAVTQGILTKGVGIGDGYHVLALKGKPGYTSHLVVYDSVQNVFIDPQLGVVDLPTMQKHYPNLDFDKVYVTIPGTEGTKRTVPVNIEDIDKLPAK